MRRRGRRGVCSTSDESASKDFDWGLAVYVFLGQANAHLEHRDDLPLFEPHHFLDLVDEDPLCAEDSIVGVDVDVWSDMKLLRDKARVEVEGAVKIEEAAPIRGVLDVKGREPSRKR